MRKYLQIRNTKEEANNDEYYDLEKMKKPIIDLILIIIYI